MAVVMTESRARSVPWPHVWADQAALLECQHDRLEAFLLELVLRHDPEQPAWGAADALAFLGADRDVLQVWLAGAEAAGGGHRHGEVGDRRVSLDMGPRAAVAH